MKRRPLDITRYNPGRFAYLMHEPFATFAWEYFSAPAQIDRMIDATEGGQPAIEPLLEEVESRFSEQLSSTHYPGEEIAIFFNNMIKQIMEMYDFEHAACGLCRGARFFRSSGFYRKKDS